MGSAIALPMIACGKLAGVLILQSESTNTFSSEDVPPLVGAADQIAQTIARAVLAEKLEAQLREMEVLQNRYVREAWDSFVPRRQTALYEYGQSGAPSSADTHSAATGSSPADADLVEMRQLQTADQSPLLSPIRLRERILGVLGLHLGASERVWTEDQIELATAISEQMGLILENARLFEEARYRADRERRAREITARMRETLDVESVLKTAADELYRAFELDDVVIQLITGEIDGGAAQEGV
jgi:GAF domain-containing protein